VVPLQLLGQRQDVLHHLTHAPLLKDQAVHLCPLAGGHTRFGPPRKLLVEHPQIVDGLAIDLQRPLDRVVIEDAWAVFRLQQEGVLALGALNPFIDDPADKRQGADGVPAGLPFG